MLKICLVIDSYRLIDDCFIDILKIQPDVKLETCR